MPQSSQLCPDVAKTFVSLTQVGPSTMPFNL